MDMDPSVDVQNMTYIQISVQDEVVGVLSRYMKVNIARTSQMQNNSTNILAVFKSCLPFDVFVLLCFINFNHYNRSGQGNPP